MAGDGVHILYIAPSDRRRTPVVDYALSYRTAFSSGGNIKLEPLLADNLPENFEAYEGGVDWLGKEMMRIAQSREFPADGILHVEMGPTSHREFWAAHFITKMRPDIPMCLMLHDPPQFGFLDYSPTANPKGHFLERLIGQVSNGIALYGRKQLGARLMKHADLILTHSTVGAELVAKRYPSIGAKTAHVAPLAMGEFKAQTEPDAEKPQGNPTIQILVWCCPHAQMRFDDLLGALIHLRRRGCLANAHICIRGELAPGPQNEEAAAALVKRLQALGLDGQVDFRLGMPKRGAWRQTFAKADILVLPFGEKSSHGSILGLLRAETNPVAVVAGHISCLQELLNDEQYGLLYRPGQAQELAAKIGDLIKDQEKRKALGKSLLERAMREHSPDRIVAQMGEIYREIIAARTQNRPLRLPAGARLEGSAPRDQ